MFFYYYYLVFVQLFACGYVYVNKCKISFYIHSPTSSSVVDPFRNTLYSASVVHFFSMTLQ
jgi:hypothetical protein